MLSLIVFGDVPSQKNSKQIYFNRASGKPFISSNPRVKAWQEDAAWQLKTVSIPARGWLYPLTIKLAFAFRTARRRDLENAASTVLDALVHAGIIADDDYKHACPITLDFIGVDKQNPRVEITLEEKPADQADSSDS